MSKKTLTILLLLSVAINLGVVGALGFRTWQPQPCGEKPTAKPFPKMHPEYRALNLTEEQSRLWSQVQQGLERQLQDVQEQLQTERQLLFDELQATQPNNNKIAEQVAKIGTLHQHMQKIVVDALLEKKAFLSDQQWSQLLGLIGGHMPGVKCGMHRGKDDYTERAHGAQSGGMMKHNGMGRGEGSPPASR